MPWALASQSASNGLQHVPEEAAPSEGRLQHGAPGCRPAATGRRPSAVCLPDEFPEVENRDQARPLMEPLATAFRR